jgi:hypothetical protein
VPGVDVGALKDRLYAFNVEATGVADGRRFVLALEDGRDVLGLRRTHVGRHV